MVKTIKIGLIGLGTVGSGVVRILKAQRDLIQQQTGLVFEVTQAIVANPERQRDADLQTVSLGTDATQLFNDPTLDVVVEVMGSVAGAKPLIEQALKAHKHVVTANKDLIAQYGEPLAELASQNGVTLRYEASVAGGIPILQTLRTVYTADPVTEIAGILNGTTNFILTQMDEQGLTYDQALDEAKERGFAETDPTNDVDGFDAAYKLGILTKMAFGISVAQDDIDITGIRELDINDVRAARASGYELKLVGISKQTPAGLQLAITPMVIHEDRPLAKIKNENNAVWVKSTNIGTALYVGPGAGQLPTGNSVVTDLIQVGKAIDRGNQAEPFALKQTSVKPPIVKGNQTYWLLVAAPNPNSLADNLKLMFEGVQVSQPDTIRGLDPHQTLTSFEIQLPQPVTTERFINRAQRLGQVIAAYPVLED
jgi:homoserine dehydrogenase